MSSYATLTVGSMHLTGTTEGIDPGIMMLFRPTDRRIRQIDQRDRDALAEYVQDDMIDDFDEDNPLTCVEYRCSVQVAKDRLDLKGFTPEVGEAIFKKEMPSRIQHFEEWVEKYGSPLMDYDERLATMRSLTIEAWLAAFQRIRQENLTAIRTLHEVQSMHRQQPILRYMLGLGTYMYGFPGYDARPFVRLAIDKAPSEDELVYDLTDMIARGYVVDEVIEEAEFLMQSDFLLAHRVIILTEGKSDIEFLQRSLRILYPHLADYFHFFDFTRNEGGAGHLVRLVQAFAAADVRHRILAMFDNDTGAREALVNLETTKLSDNIVVLRYPNLPIAQSYPTLGPSGEIELDINGLAGSLEIYLGRDVLEDEEGHLSPVQWTGYSRRLKAYQGEVMDKQNVQEKFRRKLQECESHPELIDSFDWEGMRCVVYMMRTAFHKVDTEAALGGSSLQ